MQVNYKIECFNKTHTQGWIHSFFFNFINSNSNSNSLTLKKLNSNSNSNSLTSKKLNSNSNSNSLTLKNQNSNSNSNSLTLQKSNSNSNSNSSITCERIQIQIQNSNSIQPPLFTPKIQRGFCNLHLASRSFAVAVVY